MLTGHAKTLSGFGNKYGSSNTVSITKSGNATISISDFSAGLFSKFDMGTDHPATLTFDCNGQVQSTSFSTDFGECTISSGSWNEEEQVLTIHWEIPYNQVQEISEFKINA